MAQREKFFGIEVDLLVRSPHRGVWVVEVKSVASWEFLQHRMSRGQKRRLQQVIIGLSEMWREPVGLALAVVTKKQEVIIFDEL